MYTQGRATARFRKQRNQAAQAPVTATPTATTAYSAAARKIRLQRTQQLGENTHGASTKQLDIANIPTNTAHTDSSEQLNRAAPATADDTAARETRLQQLKQRSPQL